MTQYAEHELALMLDVVEVSTRSKKVWAVVRKPSSDAAGTQFFPFAVWVANNPEELQDASLRRSPSSSVETIGNAIRMFFVGRASFTLDSGLAFTINDLLECADDDAILKFVQSKGQ